MLHTKYLIFDLEYATSMGGIHKICEFGYVITNDKFEIIKNGNIIIDPYINRRDWDWRVVHTILTRSVQTYEKAPRFDDCYDDIVDIFNSVDYIFGHSLNGDAIALNDECKRYNLSSIDFEFYDIKNIFKEYTNVRRDVSVTGILDELGIKGDSKTHDAEADAYNTMLELKTMIESLDITLEELLSLCPDAKDSNNNFVVDSILKSQLRREEQFKNALLNEGANKMSRQNKRLFIQFLDNVKPTKEIEQKLKGLKVSITTNYEYFHYKQMLNIVQMLCNLGAEYILRASAADIFVTYPTYNENGELRECSLLNYVNEANSNGSKIKVLSFNDFLEILGTTEKELDDMPMVSFDCLYREDAIIKDKRTIKALNKNKEPKAEIQKENSGSSLGDMFSDFFKDYYKNE